jgi:hypothetical protein
MQPSGARWCAVALGMLAWSLLRSTTALAANIDSASEHDLKAAFVYNFAKFTTWPEGALASPSAPLVIGVLGDGQVAASLRSLTRNRLANGHPIEVRAIDPEAVPTDIRVLYISGTQDATLGKLAQSFLTPGLLTVGESDLFVQSGGMIRLLVDSGRLQFEIDAGLASKAGLTLSSQLLMLARQVRLSP